MQPEAFAIQLNAYAGQDVGMAWRLLRVMTSRVFGAEGTPRSGKTGPGRSAWPNGFDGLPSKHSAVLNFAKHPPIFSFRRPKVLA